MRVWDATSSMELGEALQGHAKRVRSVAISTDGRWILSGSDDCTVRVWNMESQEPVGDSLRSHSGPVLEVKFVTATLLKGVIKKRGQF